jgi:hypothetical protein
MKNILVISILWIGTFPAVFAQTQLDGQIRIRSEYRDGYRNLMKEGTDAAFFNSQRSRLLVNYKTDSLQFFVSFQDVRIWGDESQLRDEASIGLHQAWGEFRLCNGFTLKGGRQEWNYDDGRLLGNTDWVQQGRSHDGILLKYQKNNTQVHLAGAFNQDKEKLAGTYFPLPNYKTMVFLWAGGKLLKNVNYSGIIIRDGNESVKDTGSVLYRNTGGLKLTFKPKAMRINAGGYIQQGKSNQGTTEAFMFEGSLGRPLGKIEAELGYEYLSGTKQGDSKNKTFNTLYATNHRYYGHMDYFLNIGPDTRNGGLTDLWLKFSRPVGKKARAGIDVHHFGLAQTVRDITDTLKYSGTSLGQEADLWFNWNYKTDINVKGGVSIFLPESDLELVRNVKSRSNPVWAWLMISFNPRLLKI